MNSPSINNKPYSVAEEWLNAVTHSLGFVAAAIGLSLLLMRVDGIYGQVVSLIYGISMMLMFLSSVLYHATSGIKAKATLKVIDHCAIYLLIAGTYTPLMVLSVGGVVGVIGMILVWSIALVGIWFKCFAQNRFPRLSLFTYLTMGWLALFFIYPLYQALSSEGLWLLFAGGLSYTFGVAFYVAKKTKYTHAIWHLFVVAGCACHFFVVYDHVV